MFLLLPLGSNVSLFWIKELFLTLKKNEVTV